MFSANSEEKQKKEEVKKDYKIISDTSILYSEIQKKGICSFQLLCNSLSNFNEKILGLSISYEKNKSVYLPFSDDARVLLNKIFQDEEILKIGSNIKYYLQE